MNKEDDFLIIRVINFDCHIDEAIISQLFDPYFTTKEESGGTGIGLYISKAIIEQRMDGKIMLENTDEGVSCQLSIPASPPTD